jgi:dihydropteroate synthase
VERVFRCGDKVFRLGERTFVVGVLNVTPDSFSDGGNYMEVDAAVSRGLEMVEEGADIIDIGGESSRPGAEPVPIEEERRRVLPVIERLARKVGVPISIDTYKSVVAREAIGLGASIVNDISGLRSSPDMADVIVETGVSVMIMHMKGEPRNMQSDPTYEDVVSEIRVFLDTQAKKAVARGVPKDRIVIDPGIGFGKTVEHNLEIIARIGELRDLGYPVLIGTSRKSFIGSILGTEVDERLEGTIASKVAAVMGGVDFVRVHDVKEVSRAMNLIDRIMRYRT